MRTPLFASLRRALQSAVQIHKNKIPTAEHIALIQHERQQHLLQQSYRQALRQHYIEQRQYQQASPHYDFPQLTQKGSLPRGYSRRQFLSDTAKAAIVAGVSTVLPMGCSTSKKGQTTPRIAIIGAGIAGLNAAYQLQKLGYNADIFEASKRSGGRIFSGKNVMGQGLTTEIGGEFIDSWHIDMLELAKEFNLEIFDIHKDIADNKLNNELFLINGVRYNEAQIITELLPIAPKLIAHAAQLPSSIDYQTSGKAKAFDLVSIDEYFTKIGVNGALKTLLEVAYIGEYGLEIGEQSALNFLTFFEPPTENNGLKLFGDSDEQYKIKGGNQQITEQLTQKLAHQIRYEYALQALQNNTSGGFKLSFANGKEISADIVVLAVPFSVLRHIDMQVPLPDIKRRAIQNLGYGTNSKLFLGTKNRLWREQAQSGFLYSNQVHTGWDNSQGQNDNKGAGAYTVFLGGQAGYDLDNNKAATYNQGIDLAFSGFSQALSGKTETFNWGKHKHTQGSYSCYRIGQWTTIGGVEALPVGNLLFAGEHCSTVSAGFMNGGAESGRAAAEHIVAMLRGIL